MHKTKGKERGFAARAFIKGPNNQTVLVYKPKPKNGLAMWKLSGGDKFPNETPEETVLREVKEETGLRGKKINLFLVKMLNRGDHDFYLYELSVDNFDGFRPKAKVDKETYEKIKKGEIEDDREKAAIFNISQLPTLKDFSPGHLAYLKKFGIIDG